MSINKQIVVGMSGHIDHGKTSIVKHLTGKNTDTLKQEQERGMTIDLGFAFLNDQITIIDVPGHEKFVKNMMSGSSGIDIAALVIAADDGIMPQTKEHFDILQLLDIKYGFIILNKIDLVDKEWIELVENEIEELSRGSFLENCKIIQTSASVGVGINLIKDTILDLSSQIPSRKKDGIFRMHIDRVFSKTGFGTVVTGTISSGTVSIGDNLDLIPTFKNVKVRNIQTHGVDVKSAFSGERVAINLNNLDSNNLERGFHLSKQDTYTETKLIIAELKLIKSDSFEFKNNQRLRIHLGTREVMSRVSIINKSDKGLIVLLKLERPLVGARGDRFIVRLYSPVRTVAGGLILEIPKENNWRKIKNISTNILELDHKGQIYRIINNLSSSKPMELSDVEKKLNISLDDFKILIKDDNRYRVVYFRSFEWISTREKINKIKADIIDYLERFHKNHPLVEGCNKNILFQKTDIDENFLIYLLDELLDENIIKNKSEFWSLLDFNLNLSDKLSHISEDILSYIANNNFIDKNNSLNIRNGLSESEFYSVINFLESKNKIIKINSDLFYSSNILNEIKDKVKVHLKNTDLLTVPEFKEISKTSRKLAVPLLEYLDKINFTYRLGNGRKLSRGSSE